MNVQAFRASGELLAFLIVYNQYAHSKKALVVPLYH